MLSKTKVVLPLIAFTVLLDRKNKHVTGIITELAMATG
jgi:hypothetical protein